MSFAKEMLDADAAERCKRWEEAAEMYTKALWRLLFSAMLPIDSPEVAKVRERRFYCWKRARNAS